METLVYAVIIAVIIAGAAWIRATRGNDADPDSSRPGTSGGQGGIDQF